MSQKVYELNYAINDGDSPANLSQISEGSTASPVRISPVQKSNQISNINYLSNLKTSLNQNQNQNYGRNEQQQLQYQHSNPIQELEQDQYDYHNNTNPNDTNASYSQSGTRPRKETLGLMMKGKTPKEFAAMQVYGMTQSSRNLAPKPNQTQGTVKSMQSVNNGQPAPTIEAIEQEHFLEEIVQGQQQYQQNSQMLPPSIYTKRSQALLKQLETTGSYRSNGERNKSQQFVFGTLLSDDQIDQFEKENKVKAHERTISHKEKELVDRLYSDHEKTKQKNYELQKDHEDKLMRECTFSPRLMRSHFNSGSNFNYIGNQSQESQYYSKREPNFYDQSQKMKTLYENHRDNLKDAKENEEKQQVQDKPKLTKKTQQYSNAAFEKKGQKSLSVVDRLFQEKRISEQAEDHNTYKPTITNYKLKNRKQQKIDDILYQDAKRRKEDEKHSKSVTHSNQKSINFNTQSTNAGQQQNTNASIHNTATQKKNHQKAITSKFDKDFQQAVADMAFTKDPNRRSMPETISYLEVIEILQNLRFINQQNLEENQMIATQVQRVWNQLSCKQDKTRILVRNLEVFLFAVQNIRADAEMIPFITEEQLQQEHQSNYHQKSQQMHPDESSPHSQYNSQQQSKSQENMDKINQKLAERAEMINSKLSESKKSAAGFFDKNDNLYYTDELVGQIHKQFKDIYDNRLTGERGARRVSRTNEVLHPFSPEISETSRRMALERRERVIDDLKRNDGYDGKLDINEILIYQQQLTRFQNAELKEKLDEEKLGECTFHPQTKDFSKVEKYFSPRNNNGTNFEEEMQGKITSERKQATSTKPLGVHRTLELYSLAKPQNQRRDRDKGDIEYEKECDECTFSPDISHIKLANFNSTINGSQYNSYQSPSKSKHMSSLQQKGVQKSIDRMKNGRLNTKVSESLSNSGTTFSNKQRQSIEKLVNISLQSEKHTHERPQGRFISTNSHYNSHGSQHRVVSSSPKPAFYSPQETHEYPHPNSIDPQDHVDTARSGKSQPNQGETQDVTEYFLKQPQQQPPVEKEKTVPATSKTMEEDRVPLLFVDVNIEDGKTARIIVYEGEKSEDLANKFAQEHNLDSVMTGRLKDLLDQQINSLLTKIDEEVGSDREEEEESGEDEQGNYVHRRRNKKQKMGIDHHINEEDHHQSSQQIQHPEEETPQNNQQIIYTEDNFDFMSHQNRLNNPHLHTQVQNSDTNIKDPHNAIPQVDDDEDDQIKRAAKQGQQEEQHHEPEQPQRNQQDIMEMHMRALAQTYQNYSTNEDKQKQLLAEDSNSNTNNRNSNNNNNTRNSNTIANQVTNINNSTKLTSSTQQKPLSQKEIEEMHLKALAATYKNYSENDEKKSQLPANNQKVTLQDMENLHMKALAATFNNYSNDPTKFNQQPAPADYSNSSSRKQIEPESHSPLTNPYSQYSQGNLYSYQQQPQNSTSYVPNSYTSNNTYSKPEVVSQPNVQDIMNMQMMAMASTYKNYSDNPDKFNTQNQSSQPSSQSYLPSSSNYVQSTPNAYNNYSTSAAAPTYGATNYSNPISTSGNYGTSSVSANNTYGGTGNLGTVGTSYNTYNIPNTSGSSINNTYGLPSTTYGQTSNPYTSSTTTNYNNPYSYTSSTTNYNY